MRENCTLIKAVRVMLALAVAAAFSARLAEAQSQITSPHKFFGFRLGSDRKIARWDKIVEYYELLEKEGGGRLKVVNMGPTTMGNPFLLVIVSSSNNMARLEQLRRVNLELSDPRGHSEQEIKRLVGEGRAVVCQSMSLHSTEIGGTQMAPELTYDLLSRGDEETRRILDNVIFLLVPCFNPDGEVMIADWYQKTLGTEFEGSNVPWLYHKYAGHDNNRDAYQANIVESQYMQKIMFSDWIPQAYVDHHHMGTYGARIYIPPYGEPIRPGADPLVWREINWYGAHMAYQEEQAGLSGVMTGEFSGWGHLGFHWLTLYHNIAGMLTESANARLATPVYVHAAQLSSSTPALPKYEAEVNFPDPWPGGWWRLRDIVDRQKVAAWSVLDLAARDREMVLWNAYLKAKRQTERGAAGTPVAYVIPWTQHDRLTAAKLVDKLLGQGVEVKQLTSRFTTPAGMAYSAGSWVVSMAQPNMGVVRYMLGRTTYPDNAWTRARDGSPLPPVDLATDTMFEFMGVRVDPVEEPVRGELRIVTGAVRPTGMVAENAVSYSFDGRLNDSFLAANLLLDKGVALRRAERSGRGLRPGDFIVCAASQAILEGVAKQTGVDFASLSGDAKEGTREVTRLRVGMYQRYRGGNMDEGWSRWVLEQFGFPYTTLHDDEIRKGALNDKYDVIILPEDSTGAIVGEQSGTAVRTEQAYPPEYRRGIGRAGVESLRAFVEKGGTLMTLGGASNFAIEKFGLRLRNVTAGENSKTFWCPGSTLKVKFDNDNPLAYGMPSEGLALYLSGNPAFEVLPGQHNERYEVIVRFASDNLLASGWLIGEQTLANKAAMIAADYSKGRVILCGFRPQHRAQTHGTFKLFFNALIR